MTYRFYSCTSIQCDLDFTYIPQQAVSYLELGINYDPLKCFYAALLLKWPSNVLNQVLNLFRLGLGKVG